MEDPGGILLVLRVCVCVLLQHFINEQNHHLPLIVNKCVYLVCGGRSLQILIDVGKFVRL